MVVTVKLFAFLATHLPATARGNEATITVPDGATVGTIIDGLGVPLEHRHLVLLDGVYVPPEERGDRLVSEGQTIAVWPMVAGG